MHKRDSAVFDRYFTRDEERRLFATVRRQKGDPLARRDAAVMMLMRHSGGRVGSVAALDVRDAQVALRDYRLRFRTAKGNRPYDVLANRVCRRAIRELLAVRKLLGYSNGDPDQPLIMSRNHRRISVRSLQLRVKHWCELAGVEGSPHFFRHTLAKRVLETSEADQPLLIVQRVLNHKDLNTTTIYTRPSREDVDAAMEGQA